MNHRGISFRLNSQITTIAIAIIACIVLVNYYLGNKVLIKKIEEGAINRSNLVISSVSRITVGTEEITKNVSVQALYYLKNNDLNFFLQQVLQANNILESIHVELIDGKNVRLQKFSSNRNGQHICNPDSLAAEKFIADLKSGAIHLESGIWSDPFYCKYNSTHLLVSYKMPIYYPDTKHIAGVVSCEISLRQMRQMLSEIKIGTNGYAFVVDSIGNFITHPDTKMILNRNLFSESATIFKNHSEEVKLKIKKGESGAGLGFSEYLNNQKAWYYFAPLLNSGWSVIIVIPEKELYSEINENFRRIILVAAIGILVLFLLNMFVFRKMLNPLERITYAIQRFSSSPGKESKSKNEIIMLAESLDSWQEKYGLLIKDQSKTAKDKRKIEQDLKSAQEIQLNIVPSGKPLFQDYPEIDLFAILKPAETIGGDLYDYFFIDANHLLIAIGDVSGKGIPASLFMAIASTLIKSNAKILSVKDIVNRINNELSERNSNQYFVTLFVGILDIRSGAIEYCNAAHNYPYILHSDGSIDILAKSHGLPLGIYKNKPYESSSIELQNEDLLILFTDGVINASNSYKQHYGTEKLERNIQNLYNLTAEETVSRLLKSIIIFEGDSRQADDISILVLKYLPQKETRI
ncbi:MAG: SpoIIE family protein phosphatase [Prolixibacteraceae bacterium]|jgi:sigma-B regulation protein RsbU (phosphoserine phosphatase)